jgi:hypothetical protein
MLAQEATSMMQVRIAGLCLCLTLPACVAVRHDDPQGSAHFSASITPGSADYSPLTAAAGAGAPPKAQSGSFAPPPPPPNAGAGSAVSTLPTVPTGPTAPAGPVTGSAGAAAAVGGSGATGVMHAAAGAGAGMAGTGAAATAGAGATTGDHAGTLTIDFKTVTQGGQYAPQNVGAVWIETASGMFVKTVERWGSIRASHLTRWTMASGGWGSIFGGGNSADQMDAVSKATLRSHGAHHDTWDMKDTTGKVVADGKYQVVIEVTEDNFRAGASAEVPFDKGAMPVMINAPDMAPWAGLTLSYQP